MDGGNLELVSGKVLLETAIPEAEVRAVATDGGVLAAARVALDEVGHFSLPLADLPADFRVEVENLASAEVMRAEVRGFEPGWTLVFVSPVSTLVSGYLERHPAATLEAATAAVKDFVGIPVSADLAYDLADGGLPSFDLAAFREDAAARGGLAAQAAALLDQLDAGGETVAFPPPAGRLRGDFGSELLQGFAASLAASAAQKVASSLGAPGWMMSLLGGKDEDAIKNRLDEVKNQLKEQKKLLTDVNDQITTLGADVAKTLEQLAAAEEKKNYELGAALLVKPIADIKSIGTRFQYLLEIDLANPATSLEDRKTRIATIQTSARTQLWIRLTQLHDVLLGTAAVEGLIPLWVRTVGRNHPGFANGFVDHVVLDAAHRQLDLYVSHQLAGLQILIEAYHAQTPVNSRLAETAAAAVMARLRQQVQAAGGPAKLDDRLIIDRKTALLWHKKGATQPTGSMLPVGFTYSNVRHLYIDGRDPVAFVRGLESAGFGGWRLPTRAEVEALGRASTGRLGEWLDAQGFRVKDPDPKILANLFLLADGVTSGNVGEYLLWDAYTGKIVKVKDAARDLVPFRVFPVRPVWPEPHALQLGDTAVGVQLGGLADSAFRFVVKKIVSGAGSKIGGEATGWILRSLGADTGDPVIGRADEIRNELAEQKQLIQRIGANVADVSRRVGDLKRELLDAGDKTVYDTIVRALQIDISKITAIHELLGWLAEADPAVNNRADVDVLRGLIDNEILTCLLAIDDMLRPAIDREGLLPKWRRRMANKMVIGWTEKESDPDPKKRPQFFDKAFLDVINDQFDYYYGVQVLGLQLLVEVEHANKSTGVAERLVADFQGRIAEQEKELIGPRVPDDRFLYNDRAKSFWAKAPVCPAGRSGSDCYFEWSPDAAARFPHGDPAAALAAFAKPAGFAARHLAESDLVGLRDTGSANTFREVFVKAGFDASFQLPIWLAAATAQTPARLNGKGEIESGAGQAFTFRVLPVCTEIKES